MTTASTRRTVTTVRVQAIDGGRLIERPDRLVTEEPMEIRVQGAGQDAEPIAVTMRTPGHDFELAIGLCRTEGLLERVTDLAEVRYCLAAELGQDQEYNVVTVATRRPIDLGHHQRVVAASSSCGVCGKTTLDEVAIGVRAGQARSSRGRVGARRDARHLAEVSGGVRSHGWPARGRPVLADR